MIPSWCRIGRRSGGEIVCPMNSMQPNSVFEQRFRFKTRLFIYLAIWLLAAMAFQFFLPPEGATVTELTPFQQRIRWPLYTPIYLLVGLAQSFAWPERISSWAGVAATLCFLFHAVLTLTLSRRFAFLIMCGLQVVLVVVSVVYFIRFSQLPSGG
ncbi:hypothetical protein BH11VER1_BH11VER1_21350 [soil metagenome]